jgi:hypothetical protein
MAFSNQRNLACFAKFLTKQLATCQPSRAPDRLLNADTYTVSASGRDDA